MGTCWYCHWGWSKPVAEIYLEALKKLHGDMMPLHYGPAHIVWEDENFDSAEWCIKNFDKYGTNLNLYEKQVVKESLEKLAALPLDIRCVEPNDYDEEHPELFPPPDGIEMVKV